MKIDPKHRTKVIEKLKELDNRARSIFKGLIIPDYKIKFRHNGPSLGLFTAEVNPYSRKLIKPTIHINNYLLNENVDLYVENVIPHEYAHLLTSAINLEKIIEGNLEGHGYEFKGICNDLGYYHVGNATTSLFSDSKFFKLYQEWRLNPMLECDCKYHKCSFDKYLKANEGSLRCMKCNSILYVKD